MRVFNGDERNLLYRISMENEVVPVKGVLGRNPIGEFHEVTRLYTKVESSFNLKGVK